MDWETQMNEINWYLFEHIFFFQITLLVITSFFFFYSWFLSLSLHLDSVSVSFVLLILFGIHVERAVCASTYRAIVFAAASCTHNCRPVKPPLDYTQLPNNNDDNNNNGTKCRLLHCCIPPPTHLLVTLHCFAFFATCSALFFSLLFYNRCSSLVISFASTVARICCLWSALWIAHCLQ